LKATGSLAGGKRRKRASSPSAKPTKRSKSPKRRSGSPKRKRASRK
jgi:hypothetical protein